MEILTFQGQGYDCNSFLIRDELSLLVDVGSGANNRKLLDFISKNGGLESVKKVLLTHTHFDHAGGVAELGKISKAEIFVHPSEGTRITAGDFSVARACFFGERISKFQWSPLEDGQSLDTGTAVFKVLHTPGHSEGSLCLWEEGSRSIIAGDTVFSDGGMGRFDLPSGDFGRLRDSIKRLKGLGAENLYSGHGRNVIGGASGHISMSYELLRGGL